MPATEGAPRRLYFLRWWVPELVTRIWTRGRPMVTSLGTEPITYR